MRDFLIKKGIVIHKRYMEVTGNISSTKEELREVIHDWSEFLTDNKLTEEEQFEIITKSI